MVFKENKMSKFVVVAVHPITFAFSIEASNQEEANRIVLANEHAPHQAEQIDEGARTILSTKEVQMFQWEK
jgi:hypothetical protein